MKAPKPGDKWLYNGGYYGKSGRELVVFGVGDGIPYVGGCASSKVWGRWKDESYSGEGVWCEKDFLHNFRPCEEEVAAETQQVCELRARIESLQADARCFEEQISELVTTNRGLSAKNIAAQRALSQ